MILWRKKEAFSDGVSNHSRSLFEIIQEYTNQQNFQDIKHGWRNAPNVPKTSEQLYYRSIFERHFPNADILPRFWMPKYVLANDASARTLVSLYQKNISQIQITESKHVKFAEPVDDSLV
jgi:asparagine synthase (glutamine-hydrolysing)